MIDATLETRPSRPFVEEMRRGAIQTMEQAALRATDTGSRVGQRRVRTAMSGAGLGKLGNAIGQTSDLAKGRGVHRTGADGFSASGVVFVRSRSERTRGAIEAYTEGADIRPVRGRWLWIATDEIPRVTGRYRMTPELYRKNGFEQKIGPLVLIRSVNGRPLLVVKRAGVNAGGKRRGARSLTKRGLARKGQRVKEFVVAFVGIPATSRAARLSVSAEMRETLRDTEAAYYAELARARR